MGSIMDELKPCPFCGESDVRCFETQYMIHECICFTCECSGPIGINELDAKTKWNQRVSKEKEERP